MSHDLRQNSRCSTGIAGFDEILGGGLPRNRLYLVEGDPGVGKTTFALQFLLEGTRLGEKGLYVTLSETKEELDEVADSHGWSLDALAIFELSALDQQLKLEQQNTMFHPSEVELNQTTQLLLREIEKVNPARIVFDSLSELRLLAENPLRYRRQVLTLKQFLAGRKCTVMFLDDRTADHKDLHVQSIAHGVFSLEKFSPDYGAARRRLNISKVRGVKFREGNHDFIIEHGGIVLFPRLVASEHRAEFKRESISCDIRELDQMLGGGLDRGTGNIILGPAGTGKTSIALQYAVAAAKRGENVAAYIFDENIGTLIAKAAGFNTDLRPFLESGRMYIQQVDPAELSPGQLTHSVREQVEKRGVRLVLIDSLNGYLNAMPEARFLNLQLHEMLTYLSQKGVVSLMVLAQQGLIGTMGNPADLTYLADTVVMLRFFEAGGLVRQAISVMKKRTSEHERTIRELLIESHGIRVGQPLTEFRGILTGIPQFLGSHEQMLKA